jgi:hypothetical protein
MPSRPDFIALAERVTHMEMLLDDISAKLDRLTKQSPVAPPPGSTKKKRTSAKT